MILVKIQIFYQMKKKIKKARKFFDKMDKTSISGLIKVECPFQTQLEKEPINNIKEAADKLNFIFKAFNESKRRTILYAIAAIYIRKKVILVKVNFHS